MVRFEGFCVSRSCTGKWTVPALMAAFAVLLTSPSSAFAAPGALDTSFGNAGTVVLGLGSFEQARGVVVQADGRIVTAGFTAGFAGNDTAVARFHSNGTPDTTFASTGKSIINLRDSDMAFGVALQADGKIVTSGAAGTDTVVARFSTDGTLDATFGNAGKVITDLGGFDQASGLALQTDGKIITIGTANDDADTALARFNLDGTLDTTFGNAGTQIVDLGGSDEALGVALQADGKIVTAGAAGTDTVVARFSPDGTLDATFGNAGKVITDLGGFDQASGLALQTDGKIITIGTANNDTSLARFHPDGTPDGAFASGGKKITNLGGYDHGYAVALQADGKIITAGSAGDTDTAVARFTSEGEVDLTFESDGVVLTDLGGFEVARGIAAQPDGKVVIAGFADNKTTLGRYLTAREEVDVAVSVTASGSITGRLRVAAKVTNLGHSPSTKVTTATRLPPSTTFVTDLPDSCSWAPTTHSVICNIPILKPHTTTTYTYQAHINPLTMSSFTLVITRTIPAPQGPALAHNRAAETCKVFGLVVSC
ncbi:hypothetical protein ACFCYM_34300 [Streptomyces sp. NPDC056254]|uniref:hypothetical protein n=1 Tax=Streptomyces sp. NPDC056254 TaxID=3345763 RepID=UPI0035D8D47C